MVSIKSANRIARLAVTCLALGACTSDGYDPAGDGQEVAVTSAALTVADCPAGYNVIQGNSAGNIIQGTAGSDCILGNGGHDQIYGNGGNDFLIGGPGNDRVYGGDGNDELHGENGTDTLEGQGNDDSLYGGLLNDILSGGTGNDLLYGGAADDTLNGGDGEDRLYGEAGLDDLFGDNDGDLLSGGTENDECFGGEGNDIVNGGAGDDVLGGDAGDDLIADSSGTNTIDGGDGNDSCTGLNCELGSPTACSAYTQCSAGQTCVADAAMCAPCGSLGGGNCVPVDNCPSDPSKMEPGACGCGVADVDSDADGAADCIESADARLTVADCPPGYNVIQGSNAGNTLQGTTGNDCILGNGGHDTIYGNGGNDVLLGGAGNDTIYGGDGNDTLRGEAGNDTLEGQNHDDVLYGGLGLDTMSGGSGNDWLHGGGDADMMDGNAGNDTMYGGDASDSLGGNIGNDRLFGDAGDDSLAGGSGNDILEGGAGNDQCSAGDGNDVVSGEAGNDTLAGDPGNDFIADVYGTNSINGGDGTDRCTGTSCELGAPVLSGCATYTDCSMQQTCVADVGMCLPCATVGGVGCQDVDGCPSDATKTGPGICGCGVAESDYDLDNFPDCIDVCYEAPDSQDADGDLIPDGCDVPFECTASSSGPGVFDGDLDLSGAQSSAALQYLHGARCISGSVVLDGTDLVDLSFLETLRGIAGDLSLNDNAQLTSVDGLDELELIGGGITIVDNAALANLAGLLRLDESATALTIDGNAALSQCWVDELENLTKLDCATPNPPGAPLACDGNTGGGICPSDVPCEPGASGPGIYDGHAAITGATAAATLESLAGIRCITGSVSIGGTTLTDVDALTSLRHIGGTLVIFNNTALVEVDGLDSLESIGTSLDIESNAALESLAGLMSLESFGEADPENSVFVIGANPVLPDCWRLAVEDRVNASCTSPEYCAGNDGTGSCGVFIPVVLNGLDKTANLHLTDDRLELRVTNTGTDGGVRSTASVASGSGVWYFEMTQIGITGNGFFAAGVGPGSLPLDQSIGSTTESIGMSGSGLVFYDGAFVGNFGHADTMGFVVDYRDVNPTVHIIGYEWGLTAVRHTRTLPVTAPVFAMFVGQAPHHGEMARFNFGSDTENHPFVHDAAAALTAAGEVDVASALVLGFGQTRALPHSEPAELTVDSDLSVAVDTEVTLHASATDAEDGTLTDDIEWENLAESYYVRDRGTGGSFTFTPTEIGKYPVRVLVRDSTDIVTETTIMVTVTGTLPQYDPVQLVIDENTGDGISLSPDGLSAHYTVNDKMAVRANQGNYGRFWYFEAQRISDASYSLGTGLVVSEGSLNPLSFFTTQPSLEVNFLGSAWRDLVFEANAPSASGYYGFAVDYRADNPTIHIIVDDAVIYTITLDHVWVPLYPMLYGNAAPGPYDNVINFGETPFEFDPVAALTAASISTTGFEPYWGDANAP